MSRFGDEGPSAGRGRHRGSSRIITVPPLIACQTTTLTWSGEGPFHLTVLDANDRNGPILEDLGQMTSSSLDWAVDVPEGKEVVVSLTDGSGQVVYSDPRAIQPGHDCPATSTAPLLPDVFNTPTTRYVTFSSPTMVATSEITSITTQQTSNVESSSSSSSSGTVAATSSPQITQETNSITHSVQIVTLTRTESSSTQVTVDSISSDSGDMSSASLTNQDLVQSTALAGLTEKSGSKTGVAIGITLGLGIPIVLIFLAWWLHRRRSERIEKPYANFSDLHSRPQSTLTSSSFYSLGTDVMLARPTLPVPVMLSPWNGTGREKGGSRRSSLTSFGLPYESREELRVGDDEGESAYGGIRRR